MTSAALVFSQPPALNAELVFGGDAVVIPPVSVTASIALGGVTVSAVLSKPVKVSATIGLGGVTVSANAVYDNRVTRYLDARVQAPHKTRTTAERDLGSLWEPAHPAIRVTEQPWHLGAKVDAMAAAPLQNSMSESAASAAPWALAIKKAQASSAAYQRAVHHADSRSALWTLADAGIGVAVREGMQAGVFKQIDKSGEWLLAVSAALLHSAPSGASLHLVTRMATAPWQLAGHAAPGLSVLVPVVTTVEPPHWGAELVFSCPPITVPNLIFGLVCTQPSTQSLLKILPARYYMVTHDVFAQRLPDLVDVPIFDATVSADSGSYCWTLQASGPASLFDLLAPVGGLPAQIRLTMDGIPWVFAVDSISRSGSFGKTRVSVQGRSVTALIAAPYVRAITRANTIDMTAQQIALDALTSTGIDLDWGIGAGALANGGLVDWLVPAGAWSHQGTALDAVQAIVQSAGGYLQSHRSAATLLARHPYGQRVGDTSGAPWAWGTGSADVELATDALITEAVQRKDGPDINAVYASGTTSGVLALVKRTGTAGDKLAQMVTDPLITHADAARQRGLSILGTAGHKYAVTLDLPVLTGTGQPGVLDVGQLVQVNTATPWRGRVRGVSVQAKMPTLRQTVTLERHLEAA